MSFDYLEHRTAPKSPIENYGSNYGYQRKGGAGDGQQPSPTGIRSSFPHPLAANAGPLTTSDFQATSHFPDGEIDSRALDAALHALEHGAWPDSEFLLNMLPLIGEALAYLGVKVHIEGRDGDETRMRDFDPPDAANAPSIRIELDHTDGRNEFNVHAGPRNWMQRGCKAEQFLDICAAAVDQAYRSEKKHAPPPGCDKGDIKRLVAGAVRAAPADHLDANDPDVVAFVDGACAQYSGPAAVRKPPQGSVELVSETSPNRQHRLPRGGSGASVVSAQGSIASIGTEGESNAPNALAPVIAAIDAGAIGGDPNAPPGVAPFCHVPDGPNAPPRYYDLGELELTVRAHADRPVNDQALVDILNETRRYGARYHRPGSEAATNHYDMMKAITPEVEQRWMNALGFDEATIKKMESNSFWTGLWNPLGSLPGLVAQYIVPPVFHPYGSWVTLATSSVGALLTPVFNGLAQTVVVETLNNFRAVNGVTTEQAKNINDKEWLGCYAERLGTATTNYAAAVATLQGLITGHAEQHGLQVDPQNLDALMLGLRNVLSPDEQAQLHAAAQAVQAAERDIYNLQEEAFSAKSSLLKQFWGNFWQAIARTLRAPANAALNLLKGKDVMAAVAPGASATAATLTTTAAHLADRTKKLSNWGVYGTQCAMTLAVFAGQMAGAAFDEWNKRRYTAKANIATGKFLTNDGQKRFLNGAAIRAEDLDLNAIKATYLTPAQSLAKRTETLVDQRLKDMKALVQKLEQQSTVSPFHIRNRTPVEMERGGVALLSENEQAQLDLARRMIPGLEADLRILKSGQYSQLDRNGFAASVLLGHPEDFFSKLLAQSIRGKYAANNESAAQIIQRYAQAFHLLIFGSAGALLFSKLVAAILGGSSHMKSRVISGLLVVSLCQGAVGAYSQSAAINFKNWRRNNADTVGNWAQFWRTVTAAPRVISAHTSANSAIADSNAVLDENELNNLIMDYVLLRIDPNAQYF